MIEGSSLPGLTCPPDAVGEHHNIHIALCTKSGQRPTLVVPGKPWLVTEPVPGDAPSARWEVPVTVRRDEDGFDFSGPYVRGDRGDRHLFLAWGDVHGDGTLRLVRGSKLGLAGVDPRLVEEAMRGRAPAGRPDPSDRHPGRTRPHLVGGTSRGGTSSARRPSSGAGAAVIAPSRPSASAGAA